MLHFDKPFCVAKSLAKKYDEAVKNHIEHEEQLKEYEDMIRKKELPLAEWKTTEAEFARAITSKEASDNPRLLKALRNPYEPEADTSRRCLLILICTNERSQVRRRSKLSQS